MANARAKKRCASASNKPRPEALARLVVKSSRAQPAHRNKALPCHAAGGLLFIYCVWRGASVPLGSCTTRSEATYLAWLFSPLRVEEKTIRAVSLAPWRSCTECMNAPALCHILGEDTQRYRPHQPSSRHRGTKGTKPRMMKQAKATRPASQQLRFQFSPFAFQLSRKTFPARTKITRIAMPTKGLVSAR